MSGAQHEGQSRRQAPGHRRQATDETSSREVGCCVEPTSTGNVPLGGRSHRAQSLRIAGATKRVDTFKMMTDWETTAFRALRRLFLRVQLRAPA